MGYKVTGVKATKKEVVALVKLYRRAARTPIMTVSGLGMESFADIAWKQFYQACHATALKHGLPEIKGYYGLNIATREFLVAVAPRKRR